MMVLLLFRKAHCVEFEAVPPFNFNLTVHKPAGWWWSTPSETFKDDVLWTATRFDSILVGLKLESIGTLRKPCLRCEVFSEEAITNDDEENITRMIKRALNVDEHLDEFYRIARKDDILREVIEELYGMRTVAWPELFAGLILAVTLQMAPMKRSNQMMDLLIRNFGDQAKFDRKTVEYWPSPEKIAKLSEEELRTKAKLGYRAQNIIAIAKSLAEGFPTMEELSALDSAEAKKQLMNLRGIGDYSAEIVMPGMGFPLDVWSAKIFSILFLGKEPESPRDAIPKLKEAAEKRWGKWRGHAFIYVLNDLPKISERLGVDLTRF